ncbi:MAG: hypothetical protein KDB80_17000, partial [Planctomycetes bacterium]|nr:hypothetical protein [Planctomycetota bacterium]
MAVNLRFPTIGLAAFVCGCVSTPVQKLWVDPQTTTATYGPDGRPMASEAALGPSIWDPPSEAALSEL